jgi:small subunit ribosomal protein S8
MPSSKLKVEVAKILKSEGFIGNFKVVAPEDGKPSSSLRIYLKYSEDGEPVIHGIERVSRPGRRVYRGKAEIPQVLGGLGLAIVSTSKGVLSGAEAARTGIGGEVLCQVW